MARRASGASGRVALSITLACYLDCMGTARAHESSESMELLIGSVAACFDAESAKRLREMKFPAALQARVDALAELANEGTISEEEVAEYQAILDFTDLIDTLRTRMAR